MKFIKVSIIGLLVVFFTCNSFAEEFNFKNIKWGMTIEQVKAIETLELISDSKDTLGYITSLGGVSVILCYDFMDNQLTHIIYGNINKHINENNFINDYKFFKTILIKKYGEPKIDKTMWQNDLYKDDPTEWGFAVSIEHLTYFASWETEDTNINIILGGDNYEIRSHIMYNSKKLGKVEEKIKEKETLDLI